MGSKEDSKKQKVKWNGSRVRIGYHFLNCLDDRDRVAVVTRGLTFTEDNLKGGVCDAINKLNSEVGYKPIIIDWITED